MPEIIACLEKIYSAWDSLTIIIIVRGLIIWIV